MCYVPRKICSQVKPPMIFCKPEQYEWHINNIVITIISTILTTFTSWLTTIMDKNHYDDDTIFIIACNFRIHS